MAEDTNTEREGLMAKVNYGEFVGRLVKSGELIRDKMTAQQTDLWHAATGVSTEAGELLSAVKVHVIYGRDINRENVIEELGDLEFYLEQTRQNLGISRQLTIERNISKLSKRYFGGYSDKAANERADKQ